MGKLNLINSLFYESDYNRYKALLGYTPYKELTEVYLELDPKHQVISLGYSTIPLKAVIVPHIDGDINELKCNYELLDFNSEEFIIDSKLLDNTLQQRRALARGRLNDSFVPLIDASLITIFKRVFNKGYIDESKEFKKAIIYSNSKVNWADIIFEMEEVAKELTIIISLNNMALSNNVSEISNLQKALPPAELFKKFKVDLQIHGDIEDNKWERYLKEFSCITPNIYAYSKNSNIVMPTRFNKTYEYAPGKPRIVIVEETGKSPRARFISEVYIMLRSLDDYEVKFKELRSKGVI